MASVSGFDPLFTALSDCFPGQVHDFCVPDNACAIEQASLSQRIWRNIKPSHQTASKGVASSPFVELRHEIIAAKVIRFAKQHQDALVLLGAGENQYGINFANADNSIRRRISICLHQPPSWLRLNWRDFSSLNGLGAIICLSHDQMEFISGVCTTPTIFARHGVCHNFFHPDKTFSTNSSNRLIFVGQWLRDFDTLTAAMELIWRKQPETRLDCVVTWEARNHPALLKLARDQRVHWHADISPEMLRDLYKKSTILFLPLLDSVANNAIVESLSMGVPIVSTLVGGVTDYVPDNECELCPPGDIVAHAEAVLRWLPDRERQMKAGDICRKFAETELDWGCIANCLLSELQLLKF